jgi:hypothetical protein
MKMRDASGVLKTVSAVHVRDASNTLKSVGTGHMRDGSAVLKTFFGTGGGGGGGGSETVTITPSSKFTSSANLDTNVSSFAATFSGTATSIVWSLSNIVGSAAIVSGQGTATASISVTAPAQDETASCTITCTATVDGVPGVQGTATKHHTWTN